MNTLERASRDLIDEPVLSPTPISAIRSRATQLRRRRAAAITTLAAMAVLASVGGVALSRTPPSTQVSTTSPPPTIGQTDLGPGTPFIPATRSEGDQTILPITLLNGDTIDLGYPSELGIAELGFTPATGINWQINGPGSDCCSRTPEIRHGTIEQVFAGREPDKVYAGRDGRNVPYFTGTDFNYLAFQIGDWVVALPDFEGTPYQATNVAMTDEQRAIYASSLDGYQTPDGFLVLTPAAPLTIGYADRASANFGDGDLAIIYRACAPTTEPKVNANGFSIETQSEEAGTWLCYPRIPVVVAAHGSPSFETQITEGLRIVANRQAAYS